MKELAAIAILVSVLLGPPQVAQEQAERILAQAAEAYEGVVTLRSEFVQKIDIPALERQKEGRGVVFQKKPNYFMMKFDEPQGDVVVADGEWFWMYYPSAQPDQVVRTPIHQTSENATLGGQFLVNPTARYVATYVASENVVGRQAHLLSLVPKFDAPYTLVRVWIDANDYLVRQFEVHEENETVRTITLSNLEAGVELSNDLFTFSVPPGVEVFTR